MKKLLIILALLILTFSVYSQTKEKEEQNLNQMIQNKTKPIEEIRLLADKWKKFLIDYGSFPLLPYNTTNNEIEYTFVKNFELSKEIIVNRIMEWSALNFGSINSVMHYNNFESGKIILKGNFPLFYVKDYKNFWGTTKESINDKTCYQTYVFTVINNKLKVQITDIKYEYAYFYTIGTTYTETTKKLPMASLYPITNFESIDWKENLNILGETNKKIGLLVDDLFKYINDYKADYIF
jgi:hypothetical protein